MSKGIGDPLDEVARTHTIGKKSKSPDVQRPEMLSIQKLNTPETKNAEIVKGQTMNTLEVQDKKATHKGRIQKTIYLPPALAKRLKFASVEEEREISEIVTDALETYFQLKQRKESI